MLFHITYELSLEHRNAAQERFKETGALPPAEVTLIGRWHSVSGHVGFTVVEASELQPVAEWLQDWANLLTFEVTPVLTDEQFAKVIS